MKTHLVTPRGNLTSALRDLQDQVRRLKPANGHGTRTTATSVGVIRAGMPSTSRKMEPSSAEARWA